MSDELTSIANAMILVPQRWSSIEYSYYRNHWPYARPVHLREMYEYVQYSSLYSKYCTFNSCTLYFLARSTIHSIVFLVSRTKLTSKLIKSKHYIIYIVGWTPCPDQTTWPWKLCNCEMYISSALISYNFTIMTAHEFCSFMLLYWAAQTAPISNKIKEDDMLNLYGGYIMNLRVYLTEVDETAATAE